ncbi:MAG: membrane dipeptidase [Hyphomonadaceae bacterium]|nr:MAG: membrane dipeptidase [Caulobacteraceae bacterium]MBT9447526.1 membrane dipeptidase [Hyphomonadaceae bacterium]TPW05481.1 MAG: membrane dipeptidase [Alphaproteobacteria bacterium]
MRRRNLVLGGLGVLALGGAAAVGVRFMRKDEAPLGFVPDPASLERARTLLRDNPAIDIHAHPGRTFVRGARDLSPALMAYSARGAFEAQAVKDMREGLVCGGSFAGVADFQTLDLKGQGLASVRAFKPGEAWDSYRRQVGNLRARVEAAGASIVSEPADFRRTKESSGIAALLTVEGADFLEGDVARVAKVFADGIRSITLVHYRPNELGDIQTAPAVRNGLTPFGAEVIGAMERAGMVVDLAHAAEPVVAAALDVAGRPMMCSHTHLQGHGANNARFISEPLARAIAAAGGIIGAWPAGIGATSLKDYVDRIFELAEVLGPDHVAMGTDMDANYKPVMTSYRQMPLVVSELLRRGYGEDNTIKFVGGNFMRVFEKVWAGRVM